MKAQGSLEFLLVASIIGILCLAVVTTYGSEASWQRLQSVGQANQTGTGANYANSTPSIAAYVPQNTAIGSVARMYVAVYGCANGSAGLNISAAGAGIGNSNLNNLTLSGLSVFGDYFIPASAGIETITINYSLRCGGAENGTLRYSTYAVPSAVFQPGSISAALMWSNEYIRYDWTQAVPVYFLTENSHCTYSNFFGSPLPVEAQCGTADAWDYRVFSDTCYASNRGQTATYCIYPESSGRYTSSVSQSAARYAYNLTLALGSTGWNASGSFVNGTSATIYASGAAAGKSTINSIYGHLGYAPPEGMLGNGASAELVSQPDYAKYTSIEQDAYGVLAYYNSTYLTESEQSTVEQSISEINRTSSQIIGSANSSFEGCRAFAWGILCTPAAPLSFVVHAQLVSHAVQNTTVQSLGSTISIS